MLDLSVAVLVVQVWRVRVVMRHGFVPMPMAVRALRHHLMGVGMVAVVVGMGVFML